jgi:aryl-alcohol dehydrogenase-like predicted oxidoreductase
VITRVVDYGGLFHDDVAPGHAFAEHDHRTFRPAGWIEAGRAKLEGMRPIAERLGCSTAQLALAWTVAQPGVTAAIAGSRDARHVRANAEAGDILLDDATRSELDALVSLGPGSS